MCSTKRLKSQQTGFEVLVLFRTVSLQLIVFFFLPHSQDVNKKKNFCAKIEKKMSYKLTYAETCKLDAHIEKMKKKSSTNKEFSFAL